MRETTADVLHYAQRVGLTTATVERDHELAREPFAQRMCAHEVLQLRHELRAAPARQVGLEPLFEGQHAPFLESSRLLLEVGRLEHDVRQCGTAPKRERLAQGRCCRGGVPAARAASARAVSSPKQARSSSPASTWST